MFPDNGKYTIVPGGMNYNPKASPSKERIEKMAKINCTFTNDEGSRCRAPKAKETELCIGHLRSKLKQEAADVTNES